MSEAGGRPDAVAKAPCRLFVYLARSAPVAVVLRRGPSDWVRLSAWRTDTDRFDHGQWMKARVYERRSDVSSDGSLFVAFVRQSGGVVTGRAPEADTWIALSRPPCFSALALWFVGGTYHTGGFFPDSTSLWAGFSDATPDIGLTPSWLTMTPPRAIPYIDGTADWTDRTVHFNRLLRDGWRRIEDGTYRTVWERPHPSLALTLSMSHRFVSFKQYGGPYEADYTVHDRRRGSSAVVGPATWADWDRNGRLIVAREGRLVSWTEERGDHLIADFNGQEPDPRPAPEWALEWPPMPARRA